MAGAAIAVGVGAAVVAVGSGVGGAVVGVAVGGTLVAVGAGSSPPHAAKPQGQRKTMLRQQL